MMIYQKPKIPLIDEEKAFEKKSRSINDKTKANEPKNKCKLP